MTQPKLMSRRQNQASYGQEKTYKVACQVKSISLSPFLQCFLWQENILVALKSIKIMASKSFVLLCLIVKILYTNANIIPYQSSTSGKLRFIMLVSFLNYIDIKSIFI